jgi:hypothetical protein
MTAVCFDCSPKSPEAFGTGVEFSRQAMPLVPMPETFGTGVEFSRQAMPLMPIKFSVGRTSIHLEHVPGEDYPVLRVNSQVRHVRSCEIRNINHGRSGDAYRGNLDFIYSYILIDAANVSRFSQYPRISFNPYVGADYLYFYCFSGSDIKGVFIYF